MSDRKKCSDSICLEKQRRAEHRKSIFLEKREAEFESANRKVEVSNHFLKQISDRFISINEVSVVLEQGWLVDTFLGDIKIERPNGDIVTEQRPMFIVHGFYKLNIGYQPLHVVVAEQSNGSYLAVTSYNPNPNIWGEYFDEKICYCRSTYNDNYEYM